MAKGSLSWVRRVSLGGACLGLVLGAGARSHEVKSKQEEHNEYLAGYLIIPTGPRVERSFNAGFSMYVAAWPLQRHYPGHRYQTGLPGTWMFAQYDGQGPKDMYSDVEGGLGWWTDTRFPTETPKFIMGGVGPNFSEIANGPSHGAGSWEEPRGLYGVAQLSPWLLFPIDGLNIKQGTKGELVGYGYLKLPLTDPKPTTDGQDIPTGNNCWTLFMNTANFKGPVAFFLPYFWSHQGLKDHRLIGQLLDTRPVDPNTAIQMETQYIPCRVAKLANGESYARIAPTSFPTNFSGNSALIHHITSYNTSALWDSVSAWFKGGAPSSGTINPDGSFVRHFQDGGYATWEIRMPHASGDSAKEKKVPIDWSAFAVPEIFDPATYGFNWNFSVASSKNGLATLPEYFKLSHEAKPKWVPVAADTVPESTGLQALKWETPKENPQEPYTAPIETDPIWKKAAAGPFQAHLGDGTVVTYYWYRFADQPAMMHSGLTRAEREVVQARVEKIHRAWGRDRNYLAPPAFGSLASLDPALIVRPPKGMGVGYVPIAVKQELEPSPLKSRS